MRLELALIVGIVFFCCWCAYIIVKMNSSVDISQASESSLPTASYFNFSRFNASHQSAGQAPYRVQQQQRHTGALYDQRQAEANAPLRAHLAGPNSSYSEQLVSSYQLRPPYLAQMGWPAAAAPAPAPASAPANQQASGRSQVSEANRSTWRDYSSVTPQHRWASAQHQWPQARRPYAQASAWWPTGNYQAAPTDQQPVGERAPPAGASASLEPAAEDEARQSNLELNPDVDPDPDGDADADSDGEQLAGAEEEGGEQGGEEEPAVNRELEERAGRRSFSEDQSNSRERDKDGHLVVMERKHLINGRPVAPGGRKGAIGFERELSRRARAGKGQPHDFDRVVEEIEDDREAQSDSYDETADGRRQQQAGESRLKAVTVDKAGNVNRAKKFQVNGGVSSDKASKSSERARQSSSGPDGDSRRQRLEENGEFWVRQEPRNRRDHHEHRLKESLKAQQWDDDAVSPQPTSTESKGAHPTGKTSTHGTKSDLDSWPAREQDSSANLADREASGEASQGDDGAQVERRDDPEETEQQPDGVQTESVEFQDLDLLGNGEFPFMDGSLDRRKRKRKRRQTDAQADESPSSEHENLTKFMSGSLGLTRLQANGVETSRGLAGSHESQMTLRGHVADPMGPYLRAPSLALASEPTSASPDMQNGAKLFDHSIPGAHNGQISGKLMDSNMTATLDLPVARSNADNRTSSSDEIEGSKRIDSEKIGGRNESRRADRLELIAGQEDLNVEVMANPPGFISGHEGPDISVNLDPVPPDAPSNQAEFYGEQPSLPAPPPPPLPPPPEEFPRFGPVGQEAPSMYQQEGYRASSDLGPQSINYGQANGAQVDEQGQHGGHGIQQPSFKPINQLTSGSKQSKKRKKAKFSGSKRHEARAKEARAHAIRRKSKFKKGESNCFLKH